MHKIIKAWQASYGRTVYEDEMGNLTVREGGYANWRNNNPGNIKYGDYTARHGAIGSVKLNETDFDTMAVFPERATGLRAKENLINNNYLQLTLAEAIQTYSPGSENPDLEVKIKSISTRLSIHPNEKVPPEKIPEFKKQLLLFEGSEKKGKEYIYAAGTPENLRLRDEKILHYHWLRHQPSESITEDDIHALMRSSDYTPPPQFKMQKAHIPYWPKRRANAHTLVQNAMTRIHNPEETKNVKPSTGNVRVRAHTRENGKEHVKAYERSRAQKP